MSDLRSPDAARCLAAVHDEGRSPRYHQCARRHKEEVAPGVCLCAQHAKEAKTVGRISIVAGIDLLGAKLRGVEVPKDASLVEAKAERDREAQRRFMNRSGMTTALQLARLGRAVDAVLAQVQDRKDLVNWSMVPRDAINDLRKARTESETT